MSDGEKNGFNSTFFVFFRKQIRAHLSGAPAKHCRRPPRRQVVVSRTKRGAESHRFVYPSTITKNKLSETDNKKKQQNNL